MHDLFAALLREPGARRYKQLRSQLLASESLGDFSLRLAEFQQQLDGENFATASDLAAGMFPAGMLSLKLHRLAGRFALQREDHDRAKLHRFTYDAITCAILATGNGTRRRPLLITYASDAAELLATQHFEVESQSLVEENDRRFDVMLCRGEREFWFDVTDLLPQLAPSSHKGRRPQLQIAKHRRKAVSRS